MGAHARIYDEIVKSSAWQALGFSSRALYVELRTKLKGTNNGNIEATHANLKRAGFKSSSTLAKALRELEVVGLIEKTRQGGIANGGKVCNLYRFTDKPTFDFPAKGIRAEKATHEWRQWPSLREATGAIRQAHQRALRTKPEEKNIKLRESLRTDSVFEADSPKAASIFAHKAATSCEIRSLHPERCAMPTH
jgi:hypothetical protein